MSRLQNQGQILRLIRFCVIGSQVKMDISGNIFSGLTGHLNDVHVSVQEEKKTWNENELDYSSSDWCWKSCPTLDKSLSVPRENIHR